MGGRRHDVIGSKRAISMSQGLASRAVQHPWWIAIQSSWFRLRDWLWYFTPGIVCCVLCWAFSAAITLAAVQGFWQRKSVLQQDLSHREAVLSEVQAQTLIGFRVRFWQQGASAFTVAMPARHVIAAASASLLGQNQELAPSKSTLAPRVSASSPETWAGLLWLDRVAVRHGLVVELLQRVEPEARQAETEASLLVGLPPAADAELAHHDRWLALDLSLTGSRFALAGFLEELAASPGTVRAEHFTIDVAAGRADLRLLYNLQRPPPPPTARPARRSVAEPSACGEPSASKEPSEEPSAYWEPSACWKPSACRESSTYGEPSACREPSAPKKLALGQATLWRANHVSSWSRHPSGEVTRAAPGSNTRLAPSERLSP